MARKKSSKAASPAHVGGRRGAGSKKAPATAKRPTRRSAAATPKVQKKAKKVPATAPARRRGRKAAKPVEPESGSGSDDSDSELPTEMAGERPAAKGKKGSAKRGKQVTEADLNAQSFEGMSDSSSDSDDSLLQEEPAAGAVEDEAEEVDSVSSGGDSESLPSDSEADAKAKMSSFMRQNGADPDVQSDSEAEDEDEEDDSSEDDFVEKDISDSDEDDIEMGEEPASREARKSILDDSSDEDGDSSEEEETSMERKSRQLMQQRQQEVADAEAEREAALERQVLFQLPTDEEMEEEANMPPNLPALHKRIEHIVAVLMNFSKRRSGTSARSDYLDRLVADISNYYGYLPELVELFIKLFPPDEALQFFEANERPRPLVIRTNTLKARRRDLAQALINRGVNLDPLASWSKVGLKIYESPVPIGATPEYLAGQYMLQSASSFVPVMALAPQPGERVLDMCASPGGKSTYIGQLMKNKGVLVCNDMKAQRLPPLVANLARLGVRNAIVCNYDGRKMREVMAGFDRVLLDAPCTGLGVIARDPSIKTSKTLVDVQRMSTIQRELALVAIDCINAKSKTGAYFVYSTCSVAVEENEAVVNYILKKRAVTLVPVFDESAEDVGRPGMTKYQQQRFHPSLTLTRRYFPHVHNMDGFYVAKFKKYSNKIPTAAEAESSDEEEQEQQQLQQVSEEEGESSDGEQERVQAKAEKKKASRAARKAAQRERAAAAKAAKAVAKKVESSEEEEEEEAKAAPAAGSDDEDEAAIAEMRAQRKKDKKKARKVRRRKKPDHSKFEVVPAAAEADDDAEDVGSGEGSGSAAVAKKGKKKGKKGKKGSKEEGKKAKRGVKRKAEVEPEVEVEEAPKAAKKAKKAKKSKKRRKE